MSLADYLTLLREQDVAVDRRSKNEEIEAWKIETANVFKLAHAISVAIGSVEKVECGSSFQDANYHAEILLRVSEFPKGISEVSIRLSDFGNFASIIDEDTVLRSNQLETIKEIIKGHGYVYVPMEILELKYDGESEPMRKTDTALGHNWFHRYFDY